MNITPIGSIAHEPFKPIEFDLQEELPPPSILGTRTFSERISDDILDNPFFSLDPSEIQNLICPKPSEDEDRPPSKSRKVSSQYSKKLKEPFPEVYRAICAKDSELLATKINELAKSSNYLGIALHSAIKENWKKGAKLLLENGADPNWIDKETGSSAINCSKFATYKEMFFLLIEKNASLSLPVNLEGKSALHLAAVYGSLTVVKKIIKMNPYSVLVRDKSGKLPADYASKKQTFNVSEKNISKLKDYIERTNESHKEKTLDELLGKAVTARWQEGVKYLLKKGANPNSQDPKTGNTPLHRATFGGMTTLCKLLLATDPLLNIQNNKGETALHLAVKYCTLKLVETLLKKSTSLVKIKTKSGQSIFHYVAMRKKGPSDNSSYIEKVLLLTGDLEDLTAKDKSGKQPVDYCQTSHTKKIFQKRIKYLELVN
ncbi:MAG: ankyrin repeat domain-containing protein [Candidatus Algichlamydia australiensis]|nr:ankyrin repeat domain-containing protein [Chlamydiales bacterium]